MREAGSESEKALMMEIAKFNAMMETAYAETAPHKVCAYIYDLANAFNRFYHETRIVAEEDAGKKSGWIDFDAGRLLQDGMTLSELGLEFYEYVLAVANGKKVKSEEAGYRDLAIFKQGVTL